MTFWRNCVFSCKVLRTYMVRNFLLVRIIFLSVLCTHYKLMKLNFTICLVISLSSWWQQTLGKSYGLRYQKWSVTLLSLGKTRTVDNMLFKCWGWCWWLKCLYDWMVRDKSWMIKNNIQPNIIWNADTKQTFLH